MNGICCFVRSGIIIFVIVSLLPSVQFLRKMRNLVKTSYSCFQKPWWNHKQFPIIYDYFSFLLLLPLLCVWLWITRKEINVGRRIHSFMLYNWEHGSFIIRDTVGEARSCVADECLSLHVWRETEFFDAKKFNGSLIECIQTLWSSRTDRVIVFVFSLIDACIKGSA